MPRCRTRAKKSRTTDEVPTPTDEVPTPTDEVPTDEVPTLNEVLQKQIDELIKEYGRCPLSFELNLLINEAIHKSFPPHLEGKLSYFQRIEGDIRKHGVDGDYICYSIIRIREILRSNIPCSPLTSHIIAQIIKHNFPETDMVIELKILDVGFLSFKLNGDWMAKRIRKNLEDGIAAWAPILPAKRAMVDFPEQDVDSERHADSVRHTYISELLMRMLEYSGVEICTKFRNKQFIRFLEKSFPEVKGIIKSKRTLQSLFTRAEIETCEFLSNNVHEDLASLWCGVNVHKAHWIFYVTPVRQREYILKCFHAAKDFLMEGHTSMRYLGYQTSSDEKEKLALLWRTFEEEKSLASVVTAGSPFSKRAKMLGEAFGYGGSEAIFECMVRYSSPFSYPSSCNIAISR